MQSSLSITGAMVCMNEVCFQSTALIAGKIQNTESLGITGDMVGMYE